MSKLQQKLQQETAELFNVMPLSDYVQVITDSNYRNHEANAGASVKRDTRAGKTFSITEKALVDLWTGLQLIVHLTRIYKANENLELDMDKEGNNE